MANSFVWENWTPSFVLLRERTFWLAAIAVRSAAAFGESVVEGYLRRLSQAKHPMMVFDALFGLTAIALANPSSKALILTELSGLRDANLAVSAAGRADCVMLRRGRRLSQRPGCEIINPWALADVRFGAHYGLKSDIARGPESGGSLQSMARAG
jgi:hypothetical protein